MNTTPHTTPRGAADSPKLRLLLDSFPEQNPRNFDPDAAIQLNEWGIAIVEELYRLRTLAASAPVAPTPPQAEAALRARWAVPSGWRLVPVEPSEAMFTRFSQQIDTGVVYVGGFLQAYRCMLDAAPHHPAALPGEQEAAPVAPAPQPAPLTSSFVQTVPDKCDRIVWRNSYYHLPIAAAAPKAASLQPDWCELRRLHALAVADADRILAEWRAYKPAPLQQDEYLPLPEPAIKACHCYSTNQVRAAIDADRAARGAAQAAPAMDAKQLGDAVVKWLGCETTKPRGDTGEPERRIDVSVERLGFAVAAVFKTVTAPAPVAEDAEIRKALHNAATSLETISRIAGKDPYMLEMVDVRVYAAARAKVARDAQAAQPEGGAK